MNFISCRLACTTHWSGLLEQRQRHSTRKWKLILLFCRGDTDNTIYAPLKREVLACEIEILRTLKGQHFCMALKSVYETPRAIFMVTEYCAGGEMMEYVSKQEDDLRTDDVSRVAFQMLDAVNHCAQHSIIHRDIKPEVRPFL